VGPRILRMICSDAICGPFRCVPDQGFARMRQSPDRIGHTLDSISVRVRWHRADCHLRVVRPEPSAVFCSPISRIIRDRSRHEIRVLRRLIQRRSLDSWKTATYGEYHQFHLRMPVEKLVSLIMRDNIRTFPAKSYSELLPTTDRQSSTVG
jgi:hypothetical protein